MEAVTISVRSRCVSFTIDIFATLPAVQGETSASEVKIYKTEAMRKALSQWDWWKPFFDYGGGSFCKVSHET